MHKRYSFFVLVFAALTGIGSSLPLLPANTSHEVREIVNAIENRTNGWVVLRASLALEFENSNQRVAFCAGNLLYDRLNERLLLKCFDPDKNLLFLFKTDDRNFDLYIAGEKTIYHGDIFDVEGTGSINARLKPLDFYRAFKLLAIPTDSTQIASRDSGTVTLQVWNHSRPEDQQIVRVLTANDSGDVLFETYFDAGKSSSTMIRRLDFQKIELPASYKKNAYFPKEITIETGPDENSLLVESKITKIRFSNVSFIQRAEEDDWQASFPEDVLFVNIRTNPWRE